MKSLLLNALDDAKAEDIAVFDMTHHADVADQFILATGRSNLHVRAVTDQILRRLKADAISYRAEGQDDGDWVLIDTGDLVCHILVQQVRTFYDLETLWDENAQQDSDEQESSPQ